MRRLLLLVLLAIAAVVGGWWLSDGGRAALLPPYSDFGNHMAVIEAWVIDGDLRFAAENESLGEMVDYPLGAHRLAYLWSVVTGMNPIFSLHLVATIMAMAGVLLFAAVLVHLILAAGITHLRAWVAAGLAVIVVALMGMLGLGVFGHLKLGFFYPQLVGTVLALAGWAVLLSGRVSGEWVRFGFVVGWVQLLLLFHLLPAVWFAAATVFFVAAARPGVVLAVRRGLACLLVQAVLIFVHPTFAGMREIGSHEGTLRVRLLAGLPEGLVLTVFVLAGLGLSGALVWRAWRRRAVADAVLLIGGGLLAATGLLLLNWLAVVLFDASSWYAVKKWLFLWSLMVPPTVVALVAHDFGEAEARVWRHKAPALMMSGWAVLTLLLVLGQHPYAAGMHRYERTALMREVFLPQRYQHNAPDRAWPRTGELHHWIDYYLAVAVVAVPRDAVTNAWIASDLRAGEGLPLTPRDLAIWPLQHGEPGSFLDPEAELYRGTNYYEREHKGRWTRGHEASLVFGLTQDDRTVDWTATLLYQPFRKQQVRITLNGTEVYAWSVATEGRHTVRFTLPAAQLQAANVLTFHLPDADSVANRGEGNDTRVLGLFLENVRLMPAPTPVQRAE